MPNQRRAVLLAGLVALLAVAACRDALTPPDAAHQDPVPLAAQMPQQEALSRAIPGFGGYFVDRGVPTVLLTDVAQRAAAEGQIGRRGLQVRQAQFTYRDLDLWHRGVSNEVFELGHVVYTDLDEAANRVVVAIERGNGNAGAIRAIAARLGVPAGALDVREADPIVPMATLRDQVRPVVAGLQINFGQFVCSIGFNATSGGQASFVTASHCTKKQGGVQGTLYYQNLASTANSFIGTEVDDPVYFRGGVCPRGAKCRFSDAARAAYAAGVSNTLGGIARTTGINDGSITISGGFTITGEGTAVVGDTAHKVGRTTGWTGGVVTNTCVNTGVQGSNIVQLCQTFVSAGVGGGDSGSDVFALGAGSNVTLLGILWGGNGAGTQFVYSPMSGVENDLGPLTTH